MASARRKSVTWGKRIILTLLVLGACVYAMLGLAERSKDSLRLGFEDYLTGATGHNAEITELASAELTPDIALRMKDVIIRDKADRNKVLARAETVFISAPIWSVMTGMARYIALEAYGLELASGYFMPETTSIRFAGITDPEPEKKTPQFIVEGSYNGHDVLATAEMERAGGHKRFLYKFGNAFHLTFKIGPIEGAGLYNRRLMRVVLENFVLTHGDRRATLTITVNRDKKAPAVLEGDVDGAAFTGRVEVSDAGNNTLRIMPAAADGPDFEKVASFAQGIAKDLALNGKETDPVHLVIGAENTPERKAE